MSKIDFKNNLAYLASAGSGKTFMLSVRYISLLFLGVDPSKILTLTFTNKAANEMQDRILKTLYDLENKGEELKKISEITGFGTDEILDKKEYVLKRFLSSPLLIMTLDSFFAKVLRKFSLYMGILPDFKAINSTETIKLYIYFLNEVYKSGKKQELIELAAITKKRLEDIFVLLEEFYEKTHQLKKLEFKKQDTDKLKNEVFKSLDKLRKKINSCEKASQTAKKSFENIRYVEDILYKSWFVRDTLNYRTFAKCFDDELDEIFFDLKLKVKEYVKAKEQNIFYNLSEIADIYKKTKKFINQNYNELSFLDITINVYELLKERIDSDFFYFRLDTKIQHILLDEFQDTSIIQYEILKPIIDEAVSGSGVKDFGSFFFVGDTKQSIYRFRGGFSELFSYVAKTHHTEVLPLKVNYRSNKNIVEFVNTVFKDKIEDFIPQDANKKTGGYIEVVTDDEVLESLKSCVKRLVDSNANMNNTAILCYSNSDGEIIREYLSGFGYKVVTQTTSLLINQKEILALYYLFEYQRYKNEISKLNFFATINQEVCDIKLFDLNNTSLMKIFLYAVENFNFQDYANLLKFYKIIQNYSDIEQFLFDYKNISQESVSASNEGIKVLTVHKSKGLEFDSVIAVDRLSKKPSDKDMIIYEYNQIELKNIYLRVKSRESFDEDYAKALKKEKELSKKDSLNSLYVAFTRAKENLFVVKKSKNSEFDLLGLEDGVYGELQIKQEEKKQIKQEQNRSFSELYFGTQNDLLKTEEKIKDEDFESVNFGLALHYTMQHLEKFDHAYLQNALYAAKNRYGYIVGEKGFMEIEKRVKRLLKDERFLSLADGRVYKEKGIKFKENVYYIDLLVEKEDEYIVIDYKTSRKYHDKHLKQVKNYEYIVSLLTGKKTKSYLCYVLEDRVEVVDLSVED